MRDLHESSYEKKTLNEVGLGTGFFLEAKLITNAVYVGSKVSSRTSLLSVFRNHRLV